jgi:hypothetical protein
MYFELGELYLVEHCKEIPDLFHVHTFFDKTEEWKVGHIISTLNFPHRDPSAIFKKEREKIFESVRYEKFKSYPTRYNCLYAIEYDQTNTWTNYLKNRTSRLQLVRIKLNNGKFIILDDCFFESKTNEAINDLALLFWKSDEMYENRHLPVYLFEGDFTIIEILSDKVR